jgi:dipeptidase D
VDEETGLTGAAALSPEMLSSTNLINLDSEEQESIYIGCAGGAGINITLPVEREAMPSNSGCYRVALSGLKGGHSGVDIHLQRGNAIQLLSRALSTVLPKRAFNLAGYTGGNMHNAIPREAYADIAVPLDAEAPVIRDLESALEAIRKEYAPVEPELEFSIDGGGPLESALKASCGRTVLNLLSVLPHGVLTMSYQIPDLVETSSNLATANIDEKALRIHMSYRSSTASALDAVALRVEAAAELAGGQAERVEGYPGWQPDVNSHLLCIAREVHQRTLGVEAKIKAIHAGLECGLIKEKYPAMEMISVGPQIEFPHSPDERVEVNSVDKFYQFLGELLGELGAGS